MSWVRSRVLSITLITTLCAIFEIAGVPLSGGGQAAYAAGLNRQQCSTEGHFHDGWGDTADATWGTSAWINTRFPNFCTYNDTKPDDHTFAYSMVQSSAGLNQNGQGWAQAGYVMYRNWSQPEMWAEYTDYNSADPSCNKYCDFFYSTLTDGANHQYWEDYDGVNHVETLGYDNVIMISTDYDPANQSDPSWWQGPWESTWAGEAHFVENDVPGSPSKMASFTSVSYEASKNMTGAAPPSYSTITGRTPVAENRWHWCIQDSAPSGYGSFNIWTDWNNNCPAPS